MTSIRKTCTINHSQNANDILLDLFVERTIGSLDYELDDWSDGITDIFLYEDNVTLERRAVWDYFPEADQSAPHPRNSCVGIRSKIVAFPATALPLSA